MPLFFSSLIFIAQLVAMGRDAKLDQCTCGRAAIRTVPQILEWHEYAALHSSRIRMMGSEHVLLILDGHVLLNIVNSLIQKPESTYFNAHISLSPANAGVPPVDPAGVAGAAGAAAVAIGSRQFPVNHPLNCTVAFTQHRSTCLEVDVIFNLVDSLLNGGGPCSFSHYVAHFCIFLLLLWRSQLGNPGNGARFERVDDEASY